MLEDTIKKVKFNNPSPIKIFCDQQYDKGYYLRGQIREFSDSIFNPKIDNISASATYLFVILVLVNDEYQKKIRKLSDRENRYFIFEGNTEKDFLKLQKKFDQKHPEIHQEFLRSVKKYHGGMEKYQNRNLIINRDEVKILEKKYKKYLEDSIKFKKESIVLGMDIYLKKIEQEKNFYPESIFLVPVLHFSDKQDRLQGSDNLVPDDPGHNISVSNLTDYLYTELEYDSQNYMDSKTYYKVLQDIGDMGCEIIKRSRISKKFLCMLGRFKQSIGNRVDPLTDFCYKYFDDLEDYLRMKNRIKYCPLCSSYYRGKKESIYCGECVQKSKTPELNAYDEIKTILKKYGISYDIPLEEIFHLSSNLIFKKDIMIALLRDRLIRENPEKNKYEIYKELAERLNISVSAVTHAKY